jgi:hypothetical protein
VGWDEFTGQIESARRANALLFPLTFDRSKWQSIVEHRGEEDAAIN